MFHFIWSLIVGVLIGSIASKILHPDRPRGCVSNWFAGVIGSWIGSILFREFGPIIGGYAIIPSIIGAFIFLFVLNGFRWDRRRY